MRATPRKPTSAGTWCRGKSSATGRRPRLQPRWAVVSGRSGAEFGPCAKRARSKSDGGCDRAKHLTCGFNPSGLTSGLASGLTVQASGLKVHASYLTSGLASYQASGLIQNHVRNHRRTTREAAARASSVKSAGTSWPASYGANCYKCGHDPSTETPADDKPPDEPKACTCGDAYSNSYGRQCVDCEGEPSLAQRAAVQAAQDAASTPPRAETEDEPPPKSDPDALLRWWKKERANFNRKHHIGETNGGHTDERTEASGEHDAARRPNDKPANPDGYRGTRIRNCPQCLSLERGFEDRCQSCDWTRAAWEARRST